MYSLPETIALQFPSISHYLSRRSAIKRSVLHQYFPFTEPLQGEPRMQMHSARNANSGRDARIRGGWQKGTKANDEVGKPASFLEPALRLAVRRCFAVSHREATLSNLPFGWEANRGPFPHPPFSHSRPLGRSHLCGKLAARCKVSRFYWSRSSTDSPPLILRDFPKKLHYPVRAQFMRTRNFLYTFSVRANNETEAVFKARPLTSDSDASFITSNALLAASTPPKVEIFNCSATSARLRRATGCWKFGGSTRIVKRLEFGKPKFDRVWRTQICGCSDIQMISWILFMVEIVGTFWKSLYSEQSGAGLPSAAPAACKSEGVLDWYSMKSKEEERPSNSNLGLELHFC